MKKVHLSINLKVEVTAEHAGENFQSMVQELDRETLSITIPTRKGRPLLLQAGDSVRVEFTVQDAQYAFHSQVLKRKKSNNVPLLVLQRPHVFSRNQRRNFVRFPTALPVTFKVLADGEPCGECTGTTVDISGGGLKLASAAQVGEVDIVLVCLRLEEGGHVLNVQGEVVWVKEEEWKKSRRFGVCFIDIPQSVQEEIISYIFRQMRQRSQFE